MLRFYFSGAPNPMKVALLLEELEIPYEPVPVDNRKGEQHTPGYLAINPNAKLPSIVDDDGVAVFDSNAILLYLAEKHGRFLPASTPEARGQLLSWLMFVASGIGPYSGQCVHFRNAAPEKLPYAINRYLFEARRHFTIVDRRLTENRYMLGDTYTIVDMALWGWGRMTDYIMGDGALAKLPGLGRFLTEIGERPAAMRALELPKKFTFKTEMDEAALRAMFPSNFTDAAAS
jgi:GST-like protein